MTKISKEPVVEQKEAKAKVEGEITLKITGEEKTPKVKLSLMQKNILHLYNNVSPIVTISTDNNGQINIFFLFKDESEETATKLAYILHKMSQTSMCPAYARMLIAIGMDNPTKMGFVNEVLVKLGKITIETSEQPVIEPNECFRNAEAMRRGE
jgi:hypothetical protein